MSHWAKESIFYHIYPLGLCGALSDNDFTSQPSKRLEKIYVWIDHFLELGINALYLGPVFESTSHGYDTKDYFKVDRRLGNNEMLEKIISELHKNGIRVILDGGFNHVGRNFQAFENLRLQLKESKYKDWFSGVRFDRQSPHGDKFSYDGWNGHYNLVKLNLKNNDVKKHIFQAVEMWIQKFQIDGLRLDAADSIDFEFLRELSEFCKKINPNFWLMGEVIHGDYRKWINEARLDSVTNYECYKGLWSSLNDKNFFEIAYSMNRQFGENGIYKGLSLYSFADNHDVNRAASILNNPLHLYPLYCLLFTMPGIPSIYYGSEWGIGGKKTSGNDNPLRPFLDLPEISKNPPYLDLLKAIQKLIKIRQNSSALKYGSYTQIYIDHRQFAFMRETSDECLLIAVNSESRPVSINLNIPQKEGFKLIDLLNEGSMIKITGNNTKIHLWPNWAGIFKL
jgi:cyclomaltodextrinase / maltogenic alpha-amylase / neopullulanase